MKKEIVFGSIGGLYAQFKSALSFISNMSKNVIQKNLKNLFF
ncbi:hypothetical protein HMPREF1321_1997 [Capnocytophaga sp. oral taxon 412 str. F0487]|nr:hypothetical protein HMPREF1321_1997 [Capnocytophaga sp. oral taxon 412 str. F0487]